MKKIICLVLLICFICPLVPVFAAEVSWPYISDNAMPFKPYDKYASMNNPPSFAWPLVEGTTYELRISKNPDFSTVDFEKSGIKFNVYNFDVSFETEVRYYWQVRFKQNNNYSVWSDTREFIIDSKANDNRMPEITEAFLDANLRKDHPRLLLDNDKIEFLRSLKSDSDIYKSLSNATSEFMKKPFKDWEAIKALFDTGDAKQFGTNGTSYTEVAHGITNVAVMYLITQKKEYLDFVVSYLDHIKDWDPAKIYEWNSNTDTTGPIFINSLVYAYDWLYNELPEYLQKDIARLIERHLHRWYEHVGQNSVIPKVGSLYEYIDRSHQWRVRQFSLGALAIYDKDTETNVAKEMLLHILPLYINAPPMTFEDGSFDNGPFYYTSAGTIDGDFAGSLYTATNGAINVLKNISYHNRAYYLTYQWPVGGFISILGDNNLQTSVTANLHTACLQTIVSSDTYSPLKRGINAWMMEKNGKKINDYYHTTAQPTALRSATSDDVEPVAPTMLPKARYFKDAGIISMFSDVADDNKIAMVFRSSQRGSKGHMHPDQNSFFIQAFGENIAIDSDYYDYIKSPLYLNWNAKTYSHNSITYDIGEGQPFDDAAAKGEITGFVNHSDFDLAAGDATKAYKGGIDKFQRDIIYVRPDTYIVIDDLKAKQGKQSEFEWWINAVGTMKLYESGRGLQIVKNEAAMDLKIAYPENVEAFYNDEFAGPDGLATAFPAGKTYLGDKHVYFKTDKTEGTKIVTHMNVHKARDGQSYVKEEILGNVLKLSFKDGTVVYVKLDDSETVTAEGYTFSGKALAVKGTSFMVVEETSLSKNGKLLFESDIPVSAAFGNNEISISAIEDEANIKLYHPGAKSFTLIRDDVTLPLNNGEFRHGITPVIEGEYVEMFVYKGTYNVYLNDKPLPGSEITVNVTLKLDGVERIVPVKGTLNGNQVYAEFLPEGEGARNYVIGESRGVSGKLTNPGRLLAVSADTPIIINSRNAYLELESVLTKTPSVEALEDHNTYEQELSTYVAAMEFSDLIGNHGSKYWATVQDGSKHEDTTLQSINDLNQVVKWTLEVPESGNYDFVMSCSTLSGMEAVRLLTLGNMAYPATFKTDIFNDLDSYRFRVNQYLEKGSVDLTLYVTGSGSMIFDWIGLIPSDK